MPEIYLMRKEKIIQYLDCNLITKNELKACMHHRDVAFAAVKKTVGFGTLGGNLEYAPKELQNDKELVLAAVTTNGLALAHASNVLKSDREVVLAAVKNYSQALHFASPELKNDREVVLAAVSKNGKALEYASDHMKNDSEVVLAAVQENNYALLYTSKELRAKIGVAPAIEFLEKYITYQKYEGMLPKKDGNKQTVKI